MREGETEPGGVRAEPEGHSVGHSAVGLCPRTTSTLETFNRIKNEICQRGGQQRGHARVRGGVGEDGAEGQKA